MQPFLSPPHPFLPRPFPGLSLALLAALKYARILLLTTGRRVGRSNPGENSGVGEADGGGVFHRPQGGRRRGGGVMTAKTINFLVQSWLIRRHPSVGNVR